MGCDCLLCSLHFFRLRHDCFDICKTTTWLAYKATVTNSSNTIKRHKQHYHKYFEPSVLHNMKIKKIDELILEQECNCIVREFNLSRKEWCNIKTILNGMFTYSIRKK